ncbi:MAG: polyhydroxyalkanoate synthesis regulator DNA-binding domain-containing protein [Pirellulales bacterium]
MAENEMEITRYPNRRLYNRSTGQYVTLQELEQHVCAGQNIVVTDSKTGEDLTRALLAQMILERHPERMELFPTWFLHHLLRTNDTMLDWLRVYLRQSFSYLEGLTTAVPAAPPLAPGFDWLRPMMANWPLPLTPATAAPKSESASGAGEPRGASAASPSPSSASEPDGREALLARLEQLEHRLRELESTARSTVRPSSPVESTTESPARKT